MNNISIVITTKNRRILLERAILSALNQTDKPEDIIVVNDGSTDETRGFLDSLNNKYENLQIVHREKSGGVNTARNQGIKMSKAEWIIFLDDDDELFPEAVRLIKDRINKIPENCDLFYFNNLITTDSSEFIGGFQFREGAEYYEPSYEEVMVKYGLKGDNSAVFRRSLFSSDKYWFPEGVNGFESSIVKKIAKDGHVIRYYPDVLKKVDLRTNFEHLSFSASKKDPKNYLAVHKDELKIHEDFYRKHGHLSKKYREMAKLALRSSRIDLFVYYMILSTTSYFDSVSKYAYRFIGTQRWVRLGIRYRFILSLPSQNFIFTVPFFGYKYRGNLTDYIDKYVFYFGAYEREELLYLKKYLSASSVVLDIGANAGHHALFFSRFAKKVYAFEPYKKLFDRMLKRIDENNIKNIIPFNIGLGNNSTESDFFASAGENSGVGSFVPSAGKVNVGKLTVEKGDDFLEKLKVGKIDLIKIDVEGMELEVLSGLMETIKRYKPVMFVEMNSASQSLLRQVFKEIITYYNLYIIDANNPLFVLFNKPGCRLEKFEPKGEMKNLLFISKL